MPECHEDMIGFRGETVAGQMVWGIVKHVVMNGEGAFFIILSLLVVLAFLCFSIFVTSYFTVVIIHWEQVHWERFLLSIYGGSVM